MNKRRERALEAFLFITFPIALFAGCTGLENTKNDVALSASDFEPVALGETMSGDGYVAQWDSPGFFRTVGIDDTVESSRMSQAKAADLNTSPAEREPLQSVFKFQTGEYRVRAADRKALLKHAQLLAANPGLLLSVIGYADRRGSASYNQTLSEKRAREVYTLLVSYGAPGRQLIVDGNGEAGPVNETVDLADNRRVELEYSNMVMVSAAL